MLDFIKELFASLKKTSTDRISNPFYGVFIVTWLVFNWEAVAILVFSDLHMQERVRFINSAYPLMYLYPLLSSIVLTLLLPWCTEKVTFIQSKPLSRTSSLLAIRKKRMLTADISVERFRAKKDVAYERHKVGAEKEVQDMREEITLSAKRTGQLTESLNAANEKIAELESQNSKLKAENVTVKSLQNENGTYVKSISSYKKDVKNRDETISLKDNEIADLRKLLASSQSNNLNRLGGFLTVTGDGGAPTNVPWRFTNSNYVDTETSTLGIGGYSPLNSASKNPIQLGGLGNPKSSVIQVSMDSKENTKKD